MRSRCLTRRGKSSIVIRSWKYRQQRRHRTYAGRAMRPPRAITLIMGDLMKRKSESTLPIRCFPIQLRVIPMTYIGAYMRQDILTRLPGQMVMLAQKRQNRGPRRGVNPSKVSEDESISRLKSKRRKSGETLKTERRKSKLVYSSNIQISVGAPSSPSLHWSL